MRTWSSTGSDGAHYYVEVTGHEVIVGHHYGSGHSDCAGAASHAEFLAGRFHDLVRERHGAGALAEVIAAVAAVARGE
ncbi:MAG: hypothetical protein JNL82_22985 [Myxococcales bacterium]|nr:hypothetical protein [Myxococcales bacterium]